MQLLAKNTNNNTIIKFQWSKDIEVINNDNFIKMLRNKTFTH